MKTVVIVKVYIYFLINSYFNDHTLVKWCALRRARSEMRFPMHLHSDTGADLNACNLPDSIPDWTIGEVGVFARPIACFEKKNKEKNISELRHY